MTLNELYAKRANVWENAKAFLEDHRNNEGILSAELEIIDLRAVGIIEIGTVDIYP